MEEQQIIGTIPLTVEQYQQLILLLEVVRKNGTRPEASLAMSWMDGVENLIQAQQAAKKEAEEALLSEETPPLEEDKEAA